MLLVGHPPHPSLVVLDQHVYMYFASEIAVYYLIRLDHHLHCLIPQSTCMHITTCSYDSTSDVYTRNKYTCMYTLYMYMQYSVRVHQLHVRTNSKHPAHSSSLRYFFLSSCC